MACAQWDGSILSAYDEDEGIDEFSHAYLQADGADFSDDCYRVRRAGGEWERILDFGV